MEEAVVGMVVIITSVIYLAYAVFLKEKLDAKRRIHENEVVVRLKKASSVVFILVGIEMILQYLGILA